MFEERRKRVEQYLAKHPHINSLSSQAAGVGMGIILQEFLLKQWDIIFPIWLAYAILVVYIGFLLYVGNK